MRIRAISMGEASSHAQSIIKSERKMTWEMVKEIEKPKIMWARIAQVHEDTEVGQVAVRFDTEQVSRHVIESIRVGGLRGKLMTIRH